MNNLWVFGDSYSTYNRERGSTPLSIYNRVANHLTLEQKNHSISGLSNPDIFTNLLRFLSEYKKGDYIIFQLSFLDRFSYIDVRQSKELNLHELSLYSVSDNFFLHPQYYHNGLQNELTERQIQSFNVFAENIQLNLFDFYYKFFTQLNHIVNFLNNNEINFKIVILENLNMDYNGESISLHSLLNETNLSKYILNFDESDTLKTSKFYFEIGEYEYHHFTRDVIDRIAEQIKNNFR
jgi:hypothetical protein